MMRCGGFWTTASAMGEPLFGRLQAKAGLTFTARDWLVPAWKLSRECLLRVLL